MNPQKIKVGKTLTFTIRKRATEVRGHLVSQEVSFSGGASFLELINCCRLCLEEPHPNQMLDMTSIYDQEAELSYYDCYEICTKEDLRQNPSHEPRTVCKRCAVELHWAYDFHKKVSIANQQLREIFEYTESSEQVLPENEDEEEICARNSLWRRLKRSRVTRMTRNPLMPLTL